MSLNIEVLPRVPAKVYGEDGVTVVKSNGALTIGFDYKNSGLGAELQQAVDTASSSAATALDAKEDAEAAKEAAESAAGSLTFASKQQAEEGSVENKGMSPKLVRDAQLGVQTADSLDTANSINISSETKVLLVGGLDAPGDALLAPYVARLNMPSHTGRTQINGVWYELERRDGVYLEDFGGKSGRLDNGNLDFSADNSDALDDAIDYCVKKRQCGVIRINAGLWRFTRGSHTVPVGINIWGSGKSSSTRYGGTYLWLDYDETTADAPFLHWDGSGASNSSTGGGCCDMTIGKATGKTGGTILKISGTNASFRPGYMKFCDLILSGTQGEAWSHYGLILDGGALPISGSQGVRDVALTNIWIDGQKTRAALFSNATHAKLVNWLISKGGFGLTDDPVVEITGVSSASLDCTVDLQASNVSITGKLILDNARQCDITGIASDLVVTPNCWNTTFRGFVNNGTTFSGTSRYGLAHSNNTYIHDQNAFKEADGYRYTPDGFVDQWGTGMTDSGDATVTFPIPLAQIADEHYAQLNASSAGNAYSVNSYGATDTTLSIRAENKSGTGVDVPFRWRARGIPATSV